MEVAYHRCVHRFASFMVKKKKEPWPPLLIYIGSYKIEMIKKAKFKGVAIQYFQFDKMIYYKHDPTKIITNQCKISVSCDHIFMNVILNMKSTWGLFHSIILGKRSIQRRKLQSIKVQLLAKSYKSIFKNKC